MVTCRQRGSTIEELGQPEGSCNEGEHFALEKLSSMIKIWSSNYKNYGSFHLDGRSASLE